MARVEAAGGAGLEQGLRGSAHRPLRDGLDTLRFIESVGPDLMLEVAMDEPLTPTIDGDERRMVGRVDVADFRGAIPVITDFKTTSDLKYAKTDYELEVDTQMATYAWWALLQDPAAQACVVRHITIPTRGAARAVASEATLTRESVMRSHAERLRVLDAMDSVRQEGSPARVDPRGERNGACQKYGGCPHLGRCAQLMFGVDPGGSKESAEMTQDVKSRIAELKAKSAAASNGAAPAAPPQAAKAAPQVVQKPAAETPAQSLARLRALKSGDKVPIATQAAQEPDPEPILAVVSDQDDGAYTPEMTEEFSEAQVDLEAEKAHKIEAQAERVAALKAKSAKAEVKQAADARAVKAVLGKKHEPRSAPDVESRIGTLYLDCAPIASDPATSGVLHHVMLESWAAPAAAAVRQKTGMGWMYHEYRKGTAALCDEVGALESPEALVVDTSTAMGKVLLEVLIPRADLVVRGFRS